LFAATRCVAVLLATMIGGTVAGLLGMVMDAPVVAAVAKSVSAVQLLRAATARKGAAASS
jgi:predicted PurR-regulated permease PerM